MSIQPKIFLVDDDHAVRDSFSLLFETAGFAFEIYDSAEAFLQAYCPGRPGCLILDVNMPGMSGPELQAELARREVHLPIIFLTGYGDIPMTVRAIKAGAVDFLTKPVQGKRLMELITAALQNDVQMHEQAAVEPAFCIRISGLTPREMEVMSLAVAGYTNKEIARYLNISHRTVEIHRARVMEKTGASNLLELARMCDACRIPSALKSEPS
jgi:FixJ family two-component response regulator